MGADELSECVQDFYQNLSERLQTQFKGTTVHSRRLRCKQWLSPALYSDVNVAVHFYSFYFCS